MAIESVIRPEEDHETWSKRLSRKKFLVVSETIGLLIMKEIGLLIMKGIGLLIMKE